METNSTEEKEQAVITAESLRAGLTEKELKFCEAYLSNGFNGTQAALTAGYKRGPGIRQAAHQVMTKSDVRAYVTAMLKESAVTSEEVIEMISDLTKSSINNYMITRRQEHTPKIKVSLSVVIQRLRDQIDFEQEVYEATCADMDDDEKEAHATMIKRWENQIRRAEIELKRNPKATRIIDGETVLIEVAELDIVAMSRDKKLGRIKSFKQTKDGVQVETYPADAAIMNLAKIIGVAKDDGPNVSVTVNLAPGEAKTISKELESKV